MSDQPQFDSQSDWQKLDAQVEGHPHEEADARVEGCTSISSTNLSSGDRTIEQLRSMWESTSATFFRPEQDQDDWDKLHDHLNDRQPSEEEMRKFIVATNYKNYLEHQQSWWRNNWFVENHIYLYLNTVVNVGLLFLLLLLVMRHG